MNRRNFLSMLSALPFVRGLRPSSPEPAIPVEPQENPVPPNDWLIPIEFSVDGRIYHAKSYHIESEIWEDWSRPMVRRGTTGRQTIRLRSIPGWGLPLRVCDRVDLRFLQPFQHAWMCMLISRHEDSGHEGLVTHLEFIADRRDP